MTPVQQAGYVIGQKFEVNYGGAFSKNSIIELERDDGSDTPLFKLVQGSSPYNHAEGGKAGAYYLLEKITPVKPEETESHTGRLPANKSASALGFKVGDKVIGNALASKHYSITCEGHVGEITDVSNSEEIILNGTCAVLSSCFDLESPASPEQTSEELVAEYISLEKQIARLETERAEAHAKCDALDAKIDHKLKFVALNTASIKASIPENVKQFAKYL